MTTEATEARIINALRERSATSLELADMTRAPLFWSFGYVALCAHLDSLRRRGLVHATIDGRYASGSFY